jgi:nifR3 family TIM-barrel protein
VNSPKSSIKKKNSKVQKSTKLTTTNNPIVMGFWSRVRDASKREKRPFFTIAPMSDVTDVAFRRMFVKYGKPDVMWTEFVSADGLCSMGREILSLDLEYSKTERPIVAQLFSSNPDKMREAARIVESLGFDGIDINMGCPDKSIERQGAGSAMIKNPVRAREVIRAAKEGAPNIPVSVKTRIGYSKNEIANWIPHILEEGVAALTIHCRTRKEMSLVPARWEHVAEVVAIRDRMNIPTIVIGNGDITSLRQGKELAKQYGADGVMVGRGIFGNPWFFDAKKKKITTEEKIKALVEHTTLFDKTLGGKKNFAIMKKHYKAYVNGFDGARELRTRLMLTDSATEVAEVAREYLKSGRVIEKEKTSHV